MLSTSWISETWRILSLSGMSSRPCRYHEQRNHSTSQASHRSQVLNYGTEVSTMRFQPITFRGLESSINWLRAPLRPNISTWGFPKVVWWFKVVNTPRPSTSSCTHTLTLMTYKLKFLYSSLRSRDHVSDHVPPRTLLPALLRCYPEVVQHGKVR